MGRGSCSFTDVAVCLIISYDWFMRNVEEIKPFQLHINAINYWRSPGCGSKLFLPHQDPWLLYRPRNETFYLLLYGTVWTPRTQMFSQSTRKSSCVNARDIPTAAYQVLHVLSWVPPPPAGAPPWDLTEPGGGTQVHPPQKNTIVEYLPGTALVKLSHENPQTNIWKIQKQISRCKTWHTMSHACTHLYYDERTALLSHVE